MTRLRRKGAASPSTLFELLNAYITIAGTIKPRPGTVVDMVLPPGTKGLVSHKGQLVVFSHQPTEITDDRYKVVVVRHPVDQTIPLREIHFAQPFMGFLYVVAAFEDGQQWHYWIEELEQWEPNKHYRLGERVFPSVENGYAYTARRKDAPNPVWAAAVPREFGDVIEPTVFNDFKYECVLVTGGSPASGEIEPVWPEVDGATVVETTFGDPITTIPPQTGGGPGGAILPPGYTNPGGSSPRRNVADLE
jgi:hypothetical protein